MICLEHAFPFLEAIVMKGPATVLIIIIAAVLAGSLAISQEQASSDKGRMLFNDPKLGANGKTCNTCHPNGKGLERAGSRANLVDIINGCITIPLKGTAFAPQSVEMQSLVLYIKSLSSTQPATK